jgi:hypothetical protein
VYRHLVKRGGAAQRAHITIPSIRMTGSGGRQQSVVLHVVLHNRNSINV